MMTLKEKKTEIKKTSDMDDVPEVSEKIHFDPRTLKITQTI